MIGPLTKTRRRTKKVCVVLVLHGRGTIISPFNPNSEVGVNYSILQLKSDTASFMKIDLIDRSYIIDLKHVW